MYINNHTPHAYEGPIDKLLASRIIAGRDLRVVDVAAVCRIRFEAVGLEENLHNVPELVIEVTSPSNTKRQLQDYTAFMRRTGAHNSGSSIGIPNP